MSVYVPIVTALGGAAVGFIGAGGTRLLLDRRQELVRAQAYARVILDELRRIDNLLDPTLPANVLLNFELPTDAWLRHQADVAAVLVHGEYMGLAAAYRAVAHFNHLLVEERLSWEQDSSEDPVLDDETIKERQITGLIVSQLAIPAVEWLADAERIPFWKWRRAKTVLTPYPDYECLCGHRWDCHRWSWELRQWWRVRWRSYQAKSVAHECNVAGCSCRWFRDPGVSAPTRALRRLGMGRQAPHIGRDTPEPEPEPDASIPPTAQPQAIVSSEEHDALFQWRPGS